MRQRSGEGGSQMVEFALVAPVLLYFVLSVPVFGLLLRAWLVTQAAARDAARSYAIFLREDCARRWAEHTIIGGGLAERSADRKTVLFEPVRDVKFRYPGGGRFVTVTVDYLQPTFVPGLGRLLDPKAGDLPNHYRLQGRATYWVEKGESGGCVVPQTPDPPA